MHHFEILRIATDSMVQAGLSDSTIDDVNERTMEAIVKDELARVERRIRSNANAMLANLSRKDRWAERPIAVEAIKVDPTYNVRVSARSSAIQRIRDDGMRDDEFNAK